MRNTTVLVATIAAMFSASDPAWRNAHVVGEDSGGCITCTEFWNYNWDAQFHYDFITIQGDRFALVVHQYPGWWGSCTAHNIFYGS
jgi:hypothetical protein